jgi:hypothetical protein
MLHKPRLLSDNGPSYAAGEYTLDRRAPFRHDNAIKLPLSGKNPGSTTSMIQK